MAVTLNATGNSNGFILCSDNTGVMAFQTVGANGLVISNTQISTFNSQGNSNILVITGTGVNVTGTFNSSGNANVGNLGTAQVLATSNITAPQLISNVSTGTAPLVVTSTTVVANLNANALQGNTPSQTVTADSIVQRNSDGNITANFFIGNGSQLTGLSTSSISNGNSNVSIPAANGNINISAVGNANVLVVTGTGVNVTGTFNSSGNANVGNLGTGGLITAIGNITGGNLLGPHANGNSNVNIPAANGNVNISAVGNANILVVTGTGVNVAGTLNATGNVGGANLTLTGTKISAPMSGSDPLQRMTFVTSNSSTYSIVQVAPSNTSAQFAGWAAFHKNDTGNSGYAFYAVDSTNAYIEIGNIGTGTSPTAFNINIPGAGNTKFSVSNTGLTTVTGNLSVTANANIGNLGTAQVLATANVTAPQLISNVSTGTAPLVVTSTTVVANLNANALQGNTPSQTSTANSIVQRNSDGNITANFFIGNGSQLTGLSTSSISNGNSNVSIPAANGNINISAVGNANVLVVRGTGVNVTGTLNSSGNANVGNLGTAQVLATANITAPQLISNVSTGTAPLVVTSTTVVANLNANALQGNTPSQTATANSIVQRNSDGNITANFFIGNGSQLTGISSSSSSISNGTSNINIPTASGNVNISAVGNANVLVVTGTGVNVAGTFNSSGNANVGNLGTTGILATTLGGSLTTAAQPNITSVGTLSSLTVSGNVISGNVYANSGTIGASLLTGTLTTSAQPNITSFGSLSSLTVSGNVSVGNLSATSNISASYFIGNGSSLTGVSLPAIEPFTVLTGSTGTVTHDYNLGGVFVHTSISANFTAAFTNVPTTNNNVVSFTLVLVQGATAYTPTAVTINGSSVTVGYVNGVALAGNANKTDIIVYAFFRVNNNWSPLTGALTSYG